MNTTRAWKVGLVIALLIVTGLAVAAQAGGDSVSAPPSSSGGSDGLGSDGNKGDIIVGGSGTTADLNEAAVEAEIESVVDLQDLQGAVTDAQVPDDITVDNAATADALSANGGNCSAGNYPLGTDAAGVAEACTPDDDVPESGDFGAAVDLESDGSLSAGSVQFNAEIADALGCSGLQIVRRNSGDTAWECAADGGGTAADAISPAATDGTGAVGVGSDYAREDHRHPHQTAANTPSTPSGSVAATNTDAAIAELASEKLDASANNDPSPADAISPAAADGTGAVGASTDYAREDHQHPVQTSSNTPSASTGDVAATNVQGAIAELASEKLATSANNDSADDLSNDSIDALQDVVITTPANTEVLTFNGTTWVNDTAPGFTPADPLTVQIGDVEGSVQLVYANGSLTQIISTGSNPWVANSANDTSCFSADIAGANRGRITYTCAPDLLVSCEWRINGVGAGAGAADGEGLWVGLAQNSTRVPLSEHYLDVELTSLTTGSGFMLNGDASGKATYDLSQNDTLNLYTLGYASAGTLVSYTTTIFCEQAGSTGQAGQDGADLEIARLWLENPANGTLQNFYRNVATRTAGTVYCVTDTGTLDLQLSVDDGSPANMFASALACSSTEASTSTFGGAQGSSLPAGSYLEPVLSNVTGSPTQVTITVVP